MQKLKEQFTKINETQNTAREIWQCFLSFWAEKTPGKSQENVIDTQ